MGDILFLAHRVPYPPNRGDKIRGFHLLRHLAGRARVHLVAFADDAEDLAPAPELEALTASRALIWRGRRQSVAALHALALGRPVSLAAFDDARVRRAVDALLAGDRIDTIFVFSSQMAQYLPARPRGRVVMDFVDMDSAKFADYARNARGPMRWMLDREARLLLAHEKAVAARADASLFVSEAEADLFRAHGGEGRIHAVENGIDTGFFDPAGAFGPVAAGAPLIVFTGQMDYRPNVDGVTWFADAILPRVRRAHPGARLAIVGRNPLPAVTALASRPGVSVTGAVPDVRGWLAAADVVVAPLKLARGVQNKVLEGMAMARPVVASVAAATGIDHGGTIRVASDAEGMAAEIAALLASPADAARLGASARARLQQRYSWQAQLEVLDTLLGQAPAGSRAAA